MSLRTSEAGMRRCPPGVLMQRTLPASHQRATVFGSTPSALATRPTE
jgi:hypothetical protein